MDLRIEDNILHKFNVLTDRIKELENEFASLKSSIEINNSITKSHLLRIKNGDELSNDFILKSSHYLDLTPEKAWELYQREDLDYILLDVSAADYRPESEIPEVTKIPFAELEARISEIPSRTARVFIISETGTTSVLACKKLYELGFRSISNISGGYKFWLGFKQENFEDLKSIA